MTNNLYFCVHTDEDGSINMVLWILTNSLECWAQLEGKNPLMFDTSHATNKYALKFAAFTAVNKHGRSQILACSLIAQETIESFVWIFTQFLEAFRQYPRVIITDGDPAMAAAINQVYPCVVHMFCTFHLAQNLISHIKPLFVGREEILVQVGIHYYIVGGQYVKNKIMNPVIYLVRRGNTCLH